MPLKQFDSLQVSLTIGTHIVSGYSDNSMVSVTRDEPPWVTTVDADGNSTRRKNNNRNGTLTLNLSQASPSNDVLSVFLAADDQFSTGKFPLTLKDNNGTLLVDAAEAYIELVPNANLDKTGENERSWGIKLTRANWFIGGLA